jgi:citrate lyase subunit beta/citryl-CoA lyase
MMRETDSSFGIDAQIAAARSFLFVPADRPERFEKAFGAGADMVIIDLEDAVAPPHKAAGRENIRNYLRTGRGVERPVLVRINGKGSEDFELDLRLCGVAGIAGVVLSKAEAGEDLAAIRKAAPGMCLLPLIETAQGFANALGLAKAAGVVRILFGSIDFQLDLGIPDDGDALAVFRSQLVLNSRLGGIAAPVDGVSTGIADQAQLARDIGRAKSFGFGGKLCIHPSQIEAVNRGFSPSEAELAWAVKILGAVASATAGSGAIAYEGQMIDRPVQRKAERILLAGKMNSAA